MFAGGSASWQLQDAGRISVPDAEVRIQLLTAFYSEDFRSHTIPSDGPQM